MKIEDLKSDGFYYLASPYSHEEKQVVQWRVDELRRFQALLMKSGIFVFPAVGACHEAAVTYGLPGDHLYWKDFDFAFIKASEGVLICNMPGVFESKGVKYEIDLCREIDKPIWLVSIETENLLVQRYA